MFNNHTGNNLNHVLFQCVKICHVPHPQPSIPHSLILSAALDHCAYVDILIFFHKSTKNTRLTCSMCSLQTHLTYKRPKLVESLLLWILMWHCQNYITRQKTTSNWVNITPCNTQAVILSLVTLLYKMQHHFLFWCMCIRIVNFLLAEKCKFVF